MNKIKYSISKILILIGVICIGVASVIAYKNLYNDYRANKLSLQALKIIEDEVYIDEYKLKGEGRMKTIDINKNKYIGILQMPTLSISLPIQGEWSDELLYTSPCKYIGSVYDDSMVLMGHNYKRQFGSIRNLNLGDEIVFTDVEGIKYNYIVSKKEILHSSMVDYMINSDWDLTLFTCDYNRVNRTTIRCTRKDLGYVK